MVSSVMFPLVAGQIAALERGVAGRISHENASFSKAFLLLSIWVEITLVGAAEGRSQRKIDSRPPTAPVRND